MALPSRASVRYEPGPLQLVVEEIRGLRDQVAGLDTKLDTVLDERIKPLEDDRLRRQERARIRRVAFAASGALVSLATAYASLAIAGVLPH